MRAGGRNVRPRRTGKATASRCARHRRAALSRPAVSAVGDASPSCSDSLESRTLQERPVDLRRAEDAGGDALRGAARYIDALTRAGPMRRSCRSISRSKSRSVHCLLIALSARRRHLDARAAAAVAASLATTSSCCEFPLARPSGAGGVLPPWTPHPRAVAAVYWRKAPPNVLRGFKARTTFSPVSRGPHLLRFS